jgi:cell shape-determining protein MreD
VKRSRLLAAIAGIVTVLVLQATLVGPAFTPYPVSLPAVLVAAVAFVDGPATGLSLGFATGLVADLGSAHPAGVLALCWLGVGLVAGTVADRRSVARDALSAGLVCAAGTVAATLLLALVGSGATVWDAVRYALPAGLGDVVLALVLVPLTRAMLHTHSLRAPRPVHRHVLIGAGRD